MIYLSYLCLVKYILSFKSFSILMKKLTFIYVNLFVAFNIFGQQDMQYTHNMFNQMTVNPGFAGSMDMVDINLLNRLQWMGITGAPTSYIFSANAPFKLFDASHGIGIDISDDKMPFQSNLDGKLSYAYRSKVKFGDGMLGIGLSLGFLYSKWDLSKLNYSNFYTSPVNDPYIPSGSEKPMIFDLGAGLYYKTEKLYMGISSTHIFTSNYKFSTVTGISYYMVPNYYITAGYTYQLPNPMFELVPSFFIQSIGSSSTMLTFNTNLVYNNRVWGGISYRAGEAVSVLFGLELLTGVRFGAAYDYDTNEISKVSNGSLEVIVMYCFKLKKERLPQRYKSIRFL